MATFAQRAAQGVPHRGEPLGHPALRGSVKAPGVEPHPGTVSPGARRARPPFVGGVSEASARQKTRRPAPASIADSSTPGLRSRTSGGTAARGSGARPRFRAVDPSARGSRPGRPGARPEGVGEEQRRRRGAAQRFDVGREGGGAANRVHIGHRLVQVRHPGPSQHLDPRVRKVLAAEIAQRGKGQPTSPIQFGARTRRPGRRHAAGSWPVAMAASSIGGAYTSTARGQRGSNPLWWT